MVLRFARFARESSPINVHSTAPLKHGKRNYGITETETEYEIRERRFQAIDLKKNISNDNKINKQIKKDLNE